jgi:hypothetical protein
MDHSENFISNEISVFNKHGIQYCMPVKAAQSELNVVVSVQGEEVFEELLKDSSEDKIFPLLCNFELPNGLYSAYLFKFCEDHDKFFGIDNSHYEYKGKNPSLLDMKSYPEACPFDESVPVPKKDSEISNSLAMALKSECAHLESLIKDHINEVNVCKMNKGSSHNFLLKMPKFLYN